MNYPYYSAIKLSVLLLVFFFSSLVEANATPPQRLILSALTVSHDSQALYANFSIAIDDEEGLSDMLKNGSTVELLLGIHAERKRSWWGNSVVNESQFTCTLFYQPLTRDFVLSFPENMHLTPARDKNLTLLLREHWYKFHMKAMTTEQLEKQPKDREYEVEVRASMHYKEIPPWLEKNSLFWAADIVPEERISVTFHY